MSLRKSLTLSPHPGTNGDSNAAILSKSSFSPFPIYSFNFTVSFTSEAFGVSSQKSSIFKSPSSVCNVTDWKRKIKHTILVLLSSLVYLSCAEKARGNLPLTIFLSKLFRKAKIRICITINGNVISETDSVAPPCFNLGFIILAYLKESYINKYLHVSVD